MRSAVRKSVWLACGVALALGVAGGLLSHAPLSPQADQASEAGSATSIQRRGETQEGMFSESHPAQTGEGGQSVAEPWGKTLRLLRELARQDPDAALARALRFSNPREREAALREVFFQWTQLDPAAALAEAWKHQLGKNESLTEGVEVEHLVRQWASKDLSAALAWISAQPADERRDRAMKEIASVWSQTDPLAAARFVAESMVLGEAQNAAALTVAMQWASVDPQSAASWIELFPAGELREQAFLAVTGSWMTGDTEQLGKWSNDLPDDKLRNTALIALGDNWYNSDPGGALQILNNIVDPEIREPQINALLHRWIMSDRTQAMAWIRENAPPAVHLRNDGSAGWLAAQLSRGNGQHEENEH